MSSATKLILQEHERLISELQNRIEELERREKQLPHIVLTVWKLLSESKHNPNAKKIFSVSAEQAIDFIATEFGLLCEDARTVWNLLIYYR